MVYSTFSKAVVPVFVLLYVALWFILRGDLMYVFPCIILFFCFFSPFSLAITRLGKRELILVLFVRLFDLCLFGFVGFLFLLWSGKGYGLWLWHSLDFSLTFYFSMTQTPMTLWPWLFRTRFWVPRNSWRKQICRVHLESLFSCFCHDNICCVHSLDSLHRGDSNENI